MATDYGKRLRAARKYAGLTQMQLVKKTGIPQSTISTAEREGRGSSETPVYAKACGVDALWLGTGEGEMTPNPPSADPVQTRADMPNLALALESLSGHLFDMDAATRRRAGLLLADLADDPKAHAQIAAMLEAGGAPKEPAYTAAPGDGSGGLIAWSENRKIERRKAVRPRRKGG